MKNNNSLIITGASGFIGTNLLMDKRIKNFEKVDAVYYKNDRLFKLINYNNINLINMDLTNINEISELRNKKYDICLYLASNSDPKKSVDDFLFDQKLNIQALINFLSNIKYCKKFIYFSSGAVYEGLKGEVDAQIDCPNPVLPYSISKLAAEQYIKAFKKFNKNIDQYIIIRFFGAYGPFEPKRKIYTNLIKQLYFENKKEFMIRGNGNNFIDAMYIEDTINAIFRIFESECKDDIIVDFARKEAVTITELIYKVSNILNKSVIIKKVGETVEPIEFFIRHNNFERLFNFSAQISLEQGILKFVKFLESQYG